jgi:hypothetical protein
MRDFAFRLVLTLLLVAAASSFVFGQGGTSSSLSGVVVDQSGGVLPGAGVAVKNNATGAEYKTVTADNGTFSIPALAAGVYTATVTVPNFKQAIIKDISIEAGVPATIRVMLQVGGTAETVVVEAGAEMVQSQTANITTTLSISQIVSLPVSRSVLEFITLMPGVNTTNNSSRDSTIAGLPQSMINITVDGVNMQDNYNRSSDAFFTMVSARLDATEQVTISTATPGAESGGQGAVQIKFVTRSGNNEYHGSLYEYHRSRVLNANTWFNNRNVAPNYDGTVVPCTPAQIATEFSKCKAPRSPQNQHQFGGRAGGPISIPKLFNGRDRAFFFINYEESRSPNSTTDSRTIIKPLAEQGFFLYGSQTNPNKVDLLALAAAKGQTSTMDPTIQKLLADIRTSTAQGALQDSTDPLYQTFTFVNKGRGRSRFLTLRGDFNLTGKHRLEITQNHQKYYHLPYDTTNSMQPAYPGFPNWGTQGSNRFTYTAALRSTLTPRLVNEGRFGGQGGSIQFSPNVSAASFTGPVADQGGFALGISAAGISNAYRQNTPSRRSAPSMTIEDTLTWSKGTHNLSFGVNWSHFSTWILNQVLVPTISFGVDTTYDPARILFDSTNGSVNFPGASTAQLTAARNLYAVLTGRVSQIGGTAYLNEITNKYTYNGTRVGRGYMRDMGIFVADSWRMRPGLTLNYGLRWELQFPFVPLNSVYTTATVADVWGVSGVGNLFKPGTLTGISPTFIQYKEGTKAANQQYHDFAPSFGFAWSPNAKDGWLKRILGGGGQTVVRGGYSLAFSRMGMGSYIGNFSSNPGLFVTATRNVNLGNLVSGVGSDTWPLLFRDRSRLGPPAFPTSPVYPITGVVSDSIRVFDPNLRTPYAQSWSFGLQRELNRNMAIEVRYVATRGLQMWQTFNLNEQNIVENGMFDEFKLAMANLQANMAAGRGNTFKYAGPNTGTSPLPITLAYFSGIPASQSGDTTKYTSSNFTSTTWVNTLAQMNPNPSSYASNLWSDATRRANALAGGLAANFFIVNPNLQGGATIQGNGGMTWYDSMVVELRRRMSKGLLVQANYVWAKSFSTSRLSFRRPWDKNLGDAAPHALKFSWLYELPIGRGRTLLTNAHPVISRIFGGWDFYGVSRIQSGDLQDFGNVRLVGMTLDQLRSVYRLRFDDVNRQIYALPQDIIDNTIKAYNVSATSATGYSTTLGVPTGRYVAPANTKDCIQIVSGDCVARSNYVRGTRFVNFDLSLVKMIRFSESRSFELRGEFYDAFNFSNIDKDTCAGSSQTCGQITSSGSSGRRIQIVGRINF